MLINSLEPNNFVITGLVAYSSILKKGQYKDPKTQELSEPIYSLTIFDRYTDEIKSRLEYMFLNEIYDKNGNHQKLYFEDCEKANTFPVNTKRLEAVKIKTLNPNHDQDRERIVQIKLVNRFDDPRVEVKLLDGTIVSLRDAIQKFPFQGNGNEPIFHTKIKAHFKVVYYNKERQGAYFNLITAHIDLSDQPKTKSYEKLENEGNKDQNPITPYDKVQQMFASL